MSFIDPTKVELAGNTNYENLNIYVDLKAERRSRTIINNDTNEAQSIASGTFNLMGYKKNADGSKVFTTEYTNIYRNSTNESGYFEGFGITNISIEVNASYVPTVNIEFVDIKGMAFFNKKEKEKSPYSVLFDFPPPIFTLIVKGYYGYGLEYKLHLLRQNSRFEAETGNYYITAEFVANTFAPLADILFQYVLTSSKLDNEENSTDGRDGVNNLQELIIKSKTIKETIVTKLNSVTNETTKISERINIIGDIIKNENELKNNIKFLEISVQPPPLNDINILENSFRLSNYNDTSRYYLFLEIKNTGNAITDGNQRLLLQNLYTDIFINGDKNIYFEIGRTVEINQSSGTIENKNISNSEIYYIEITNLYKNIYATYESELTDYSDRLEQIKNKTKEIIIDELGFEPTIYEVMRIICKDIDRWVSILGETYNNSLSYIKGNKNKFVSSIRNFTRDTDIYPFPDIIENGKKTIPRGNLSDMPEIKLVDDFINAFIERKKNENEEPLSTEKITNINGDVIWIPINPLDSTYYNKTNTSPYLNLPNHKEVIRTFISRYYIYNYFTLTNSINDKIKSNVIEKFFNLEYENFINSINQINVLRALKELKFDKNNFASELESELDGNIISFDSINNILDNLDININGNYSGIIFINNSGSNILPKNPNPVLISQYKNYLFENPTNNYINNNRNILKNDNSIYKCNNITPSDFGLTTNDKNNIIYYDGNNIEKTSYNSFDISGFFNKFTSLSFSDFDFNKNILDSININTPAPNLIGSGYKENLLINASTNINQILYDYYCVDRDNFTKIFGYLNIIYIPDLKHIITVLLNKAVIAEMPELVKLYISAYVYGIENNLIDVDLSEFNTRDQEIFQASSDFTTNKDFIYQLYKINRNKLLSTNLFTYNIKIRKDFINLLKNLSQEDKETFINYYKNLVKKDGNGNDPIFVKKFDNLINGLRQENGKFISSTTGNKIIYNLDDIKEQAILYDLKQKTVIINSSNNTFSDKSNFNIFNNFTNNDIIINNIKENFKNDQFKEYFNYFFTRLNNNLDSKINELSKNDENNLLLSSERNKDTFDVLRVESYYSFKNFIDRWFKVYDVDAVDTSKGFLLTTPNNETTSFFDLFKFVNRFYDDTDAKNIIIDTTILADFESDMNVNMLTVIARLLNHNGFEFYPLQNFIDYTNPGNSNNNWNSDNVFTPFLGSNKILSSPSFTCMYIGDKSRYLDVGINSSNTFSNDGFTSENLPEDSIPSMNKWFGFFVKFGDGKQSIFSTIELNTEEHQPTNESLSAMSQILDSGPNTPVPVYQNLYSTYEQRSYTCKVKMFGNAMIQPTQLFDLKNIPMFSGVYIILKVKHSIDGETNSMVTEFEGVRLPRENREFITNSFEVYGKNLLPSLEQYADIRTSTSQRPSKALETKDNKIYLLNDNTELSINFTSLLLTYLTNKNISVLTTIDENIAADDIVIQIGFNVGSVSDSGTEILIKDGTNQYIIDYSKKILDVISSTLSISKIGNNIGLPNGIRTDNSNSLFQTNNNVMLIRLLYSTNKKDLRIYENKKLELVEKIGGILANNSLSGNEKDLLNISTYSILNTLKYSNVNNRTNPFIVTNKEKIKNNYLTGDKYYIYTAKGISPREADIFKNISKSSYMDTVFSQIELSAQKHELDAMFLAGVISVESSFNPAAYSNGNAMGITQFIRTAALIDVFQKLQSTKKQTTNVFVYEGSSFIQKNITHGDILNILLKGLNNVTIGSDLYSFLKNISGSELNKLEKNIFNNPYIMIELAAIYFKILEKDNKLTKIKNLGILAISYNIGSITYNYDQNADKPYFNNLIAKYKVSVKNNKKDQIDSILGKEGGQGLPYPEKILDFLMKFGIINSNQLVKEKVVN